MCNYYNQHKGIPSSSRWEEVKYGTEGGFWKSSVITEADINFSTGIYNICDMIDIYVVIDTLIDLGAIVITTIIIVEATPVVVANMQALVYYIKNFGIRQGLEMYVTLGVENLPNGVISWLQTDMADGDGSLDDFVEKGDSYTVKDGIGSGYNPLEDIVYTDKVKQQMALGDYHSFPEAVERFGDMGKISTIVGGDGVSRTLVEIEGSYMGKEGIFQYIIELDGITCNHRLFVPD